MSPRLLQLIQALTIVLALATAPARGFGQDTQIPFDPAGRVDALDAEQAGRAGLFVQEYPGFVEARLFQSPDSVVALEVIVRRGGRNVRERVVLSAAELAGIRQRFAPTAGAAAIRREQDSRYLLLGGTTALGLGLYGWAVPVALDVNDGKVATGLYMLAASASFIGPWTLTSGTHVSPAMAELAIYGGSRGFLHGGMLHYLATGDDDEDAVCDEFGCYSTGDDFPKRGALGVGVIAGVAEGLAGYRWAARTGMSGGRANAIGTAGDWGLLNGLGTSVLLGVDGEDNARAMSALGLAGAAGGIYLGNHLAQQRDFSVGDVEVVSTSGWLGAFAAAATADLAGLGNEDKAMVAAAMGGALGGIALGDRLVSNTDFRYGQATLIRLGTLAGGLLGVGTGILLEPDDSDGTLVTTATAAGAVAGFAVMHRVVAPAARVALAPRGDLEVDLLPEGVLALATRDRSSTRPAPLVAVRYSF